MKVLNDTLQCLMDSLRSIPASSHIFLCGDFNLPGIKWEENQPVGLTRDASLMRNLQQEVSLQQLVDIPTRGSHILDLLFTNSIHSIDGVEVVDGIPGSDYDAVRFSFKASKPSILRHKRHSYNFKKANFDQFRDLLSIIPWNSCFLGDSIEDAWMKFKDLLITAADQCIPRVALKPRKRLNWLSDDTLRMIRRKRWSYKVAKCTRKDNDYRRYRAVSNAVHDATRGDHRNHQEEITSNLHNDPRCFWRWLKNIRGGKPSITNLNFQNKVLTSASDKAVALNSYFCSVFTKETTTNLGKLRDVLLQSRSEEIIATVLIGENEVYEELCKINPNKACGPDDIPGRLLKQGAAWIADPLSLWAGTLPDDWRKANVTPIFKKGSRHSLSNYRPVSLTSLVVKVLERLIHAGVSEFFASNNKLCPSQHGFRKGHSCQTQLLATVHDWASSLDKRTSTHAVFLDFSKAFDSVPHQRLLLKLENMGVRGSLLDWFRVFLSNRHQRVLVDGYSSDWKPVTSGVPQGSILGPLLFLAYVNDIGDNLKSSVRLFADDCTIYKQVQKLSDCELLQADLDSLFHWSQTWQLNFNLSKCKVIRLTNKRNLTQYTYRINNVPLDWVSTFKYLGVKLNCKLSWVDHVTEVTLKASRVLNILRRSLRGCSKDAKVKAYTALVRPHLEYTVLQSGHPINRA